MSKFISLFSRKQSTTPFHQLTLARKCMGMIYNERQKVWFQRQFGTKPCRRLSKRSGFLRVEQRHCPPCWPSWSGRANMQTQVALYVNGRATNETPCNGSYELLISSPPVKTTVEKKKMEIKLVAISPLLSITVWSAVWRAAALIATLRLE